MTQTGSILTILNVKIDPYSGLKIDPEFRVKYADPGVRVNLTCLRRWHIDQDMGRDLTLFGLNLTRMFLECSISNCVIVNGHVIERSSYVSDIVRARRFVVRFFLQ